MSLNRRIASYNVLSNHLASSSYFIYCTPEYLDSEYRFNGLRAKLEREISEKSIVCLQEVSHQWAGRLHAFFASKNYYFVTGLYGNKFNGYMGVGVAVPLDRYELIDVDITKIVGTKSRPNIPSPSFWTQLVTKFVDFVKRLLGIPTPLSYWEYAYGRNNDMVSLGLRCKESHERFYVGNYHMPCAFHTPQVMTIHCSLAAQHLQRLSKSHPYVLAGDFNITPTSDMYKLLTQGRIDTTSSAFPVNEVGDKWSTDVHPLRSAYVIATGKEPDFTNYGHTREQKEAFVDTLDYIFLSNHWKVNAVEKLPSRSASGGPLPSAKEYSDHLLIAAELELLI